MKMPMKMPMKMRMKMCTAAQVSGQLEDALMQQGGEPDLQSFLIKHIKGTLNLNAGIEGIQSAFSAAHQQSEANRQAAFEEFQRLYQLSPEAEGMLDRIIDDPLAAVELDLNAIAELFASLSQEELIGLLYPAGQ